MQKLTTSGEFISKFGTQDSTKGGKLRVTIPGVQRTRKRSGRYNTIYACGICLDKDGRVYVSESGNNRISVFEAA